MHSLGSLSPSRGTGGAKPHSSAHRHTSHVTWARSHRVLALAHLLVAALVVCAPPAVLAATQHSELMWSATPSTVAKLLHPNAWVMVPGLNLTLSLPNEDTVVISYTLSVTADKPHHPGGDFLNDAQPNSGLADFVGARLVVDGIPYRQSGSHTSPLGRFEVSASQLRGQLVAELGSGAHQVQVQWRKWGAFVRSWASNPHAHDGFASGRTLVVSGDHRAVWYTQPLSPARLAVNNQWQDVPDSSVSFTTHESRPHRFTYIIHARPETAPGVDVHKLRDALSTRLVVDGVPYRESAASFRSHSATFISACLVGTVVLDLGAGAAHTVSLQWLKQGTGVAAWRVQPRFLDGFTTSRSVTVITERFPLVHHEVLSGLAAPRSTDPEHLAWHDIQDGQLTFTVHTTSMVHLTYSLNLMRYGQPSHDAWSWDRWGTAATRLVIDNLPMTHTAASLDGTVRHQGILTGETVVRVTPGTHTVRVQWKLTGSDPEAWASFRDVMKGYGGGEVLVGTVSALNNQLSLHGPDTAMGYEDEDVAIDGVYALDVDAFLAADALLSAVLFTSQGTLTLANGRNSLVFASGDGVRDQYVSFSATLADINTALASVVYRSPLDYHGPASVTVEVSDHGNVGSGGPTNATKVVALHIAAVNDAPTLTVPAAQTVREDETLVMRGMTLFDVDVTAGGQWVDDAAVPHTTADGVALMSVSMYVLAGRLSLHTTSGLRFTRGDGVGDAAMAFEGTLDAINDALQDVAYTPNEQANTHHVAELLTVTVTDLGHAGLSGTLPVGVAAPALDADGRLVLSDTKTVPVSITPVNDAPEIVVPQSQTVLLPGFSVSDVDMGTSGEPAARVVEFSVCVFLSPSHHVPCCFALCVAFGVSCVRVQPQMHCLV